MMELKRTSEQCLEINKETYSNLGWWQVLRRPLKEDEAFKRSL